MWYLAITTDQQTLPPIEAGIEPQSDPINDRPVPLSDPQRPGDATTPGTEYWLP